MRKPKEWVLGLNLIDLVHKQKRKKKVVEERIRRNSVGLLSGFASNLEKVQRKLWQTHEDDFLLKSQVFRIQDLALSGSWLTVKSNRRRVEFYTQQQILTNGLAMRKIRVKTTPKILSPKGRQKFKVS